MLPPRNDTFLRIAAPDRVMSRAVWPVPMALRRSLDEML